MTQWIEPKSSSQLDLRKEQSVRRSRKAAPLGNRQQSKVALRNAVRTGDFRQLEQAS